MLNAGAVIQIDGTAKITGYDARTHSTEIRQRIGFMPDFFNLYSDLTLTETLVFFADAYGVPETEIPQRVRETLETVDLAEKSSEMVRNLSRGMTQRMGLATLLVRDPQVLLLDEPASGLDPLARRQLRDILKRLQSQGRAVIVSSHILPELEGFCTDMIVMDHGRIVVSGSVGEVARQISSVRSFSIGVKDPAVDLQLVFAPFAEVDAQREESGLWLIQVGDAAFDESELVKTLVEAGVRVTKFAECRQGIEDVFMMVSGQPKQSGAHEEGAQ